MVFFILTYELVEDYLSKRPAYRAEHLALASEAQGRGELVLGGALADPADQAVLVFRAVDRNVAEAFAKQDPYVRNGLVKSWKVRLWTVVIGEEGIAAARA